MPRPVIQGSRPSSSPLLRPSYFSRVVSSWTMSFKLMLPQSCFRERVCLGTSETMPLASELPDEGSDGMRASYGGAGVAEHIAMKLICVQCSSMRQRTAFRCFDRGSEGSFCRSYCGSGEWLVGIPMDRILFRRARTCFQRLLWCCSVQQDA